MAFTFFAELIDGTDKWRVVCCKELETEDHSIIGQNLSEQYAKELAEKLCVSDATSDNLTASPE